MVTKIEWSKRFAEDAKNIIVFLRENASESTIDTFKIKLENKILKVAEYPETGRKAGRKKSVRYVKFLKHYHLFYRITGSILYISAIFDTRQNPLKRPF